MKLFIKDGYTTRVGFHGQPNRAALEFDVRPWTGMEGGDRWREIAKLPTSEQTKLVIGDMLGDAEKGIAPQVANWNLETPMTFENLRELRYIEFQLIMYTMYGIMYPDYEVIEDEDGNRKEVPYAIEEAREGN